MKTGLELAEQVVGFRDIVATLIKNAFQKFDNTWRETDRTERGDFSGRFLALSNGMIMATLPICGQWANENDELNMDSNSWRAKVVINRLT